MNLRASPSEQPLIVIDTNIVLDLFVFDDPGARHLHKSLLTRALQWLATAPMRDELADVLERSLIAQRLQLRGTVAADVLDQFDQHSRLLPQPCMSDLRCRDPDDQMFIDLALAHRAMLLSKDRQVLRLRRALLARGVVASPLIPN